MADTIVKQSNYPLYQEGTAGELRLNRRGELVTVPLLVELVDDGRVFVASDADENDTVTGQTSFLATTPTFLLKVPTGTTARVLWVHLDQAGTVAGGPITAVLSFDRADRYASGGASETIRHMRTDQPNSATCTLYSGATAAAATDACALKHITLDQDVTDPNQTKSVHEIGGVTFVSPLLVGPAAFLVFTYAGTTGPTWNWSIGWAEMSTTVAK